MPPNLPRKPSHKALRKGRHSQAGQIYLVTFTTHDRVPLFTDYELAFLVARTVHQPQQWPHAQLLAWVLMPDHWHGLIALRGHESLGKAVSGLKGNITRVLHATIARPIWARAFHDRALRRDDDLKAIARYIIMNPVRAGLVTSPRFYPYWNAIWF